MKRIYLMAMVLLAGFSSFSQVSTGNVFIGGGIEFSSVTNKQHTANSTMTMREYNSVFLTPSLGYFIADNIAIGVGFGFGRITETYPFFGNDQDITTVYGISPFLRKYWNLSDSFYLFGEGSIGVASGTEKEKIDGNTETVGKFNFFSVGIAPGLAFFPSEKFAFEFKFSLLSWEKYSDINPDNTDNRRNSTGINFGLDTFAPSIGVYYFLGK
jgi:hypothetical protein